MPAWAVTSVKVTGAGATMPDPAMLDSAATQAAETTPRSTPSVGASRGGQHRFGRSGRDIQRHALVIVNLLALVVILRAEQTRFGGDEARGFLRLEALEKHLFAPGARRVAQAAQAQHPGIVHL